MSDFENKIGAILNNPDLMSQIMSMANSLGQTQAPQEPEPTALPEINPEAIQQIMGMVRKTGIDRNQQALLSALRPYLSEYRLGKLEKAMRAAKLAGAASGAMRSGALSFLTGR